MLVLQDPADRTNDLGRKAFAWRHIQATFLKARDTLLRDINAKDRPESLLKALVGGCEEVFGPKREAAREYARRAEEPIEVGHIKPMNIRKLTGENDLRALHVDSGKEMGMDLIDKGDKIETTESLLDDDDPNGLGEDDIDEKIAEENGVVEEQEMEEPNQKQSKQKLENNTVL
jgi:DNA polymerase sigma